jgi:hypothetical protein
MVCGTTAALDAPGNRSHSLHTSVNTLRHCKMSRSSGNNRGKIFTRLWDLESEPRRCDVRTYPLPSMRMNPEYMAEHKSNAENNQCWQT